MRPMKTCKLRKRLSSRQTSRHLPSLTLWVGSKVNSVDKRLVPGLPRLTTFSYLLQLHGSIAHHSRLIDPVVDPSLSTRRARRWPANLDSSILSLTHHYPSTPSPLSHQTHLYNLPLVHRHQTFHNYTSHPLASPGVLEATVEKPKFSALSLYTLIHVTLKHGGF